METRDNKQISSDNLAELAEVVLKNDILESDGKTFKQKRGFVNAILFIVDFEKKMLECFKNKNMIWWRYIDIFFIWEHIEESLKNFLEEINMFHSAIKFTSEILKRGKKIFDVNVKLTDGELDLI